MPSPTPPKTLSEALVALQAQLPRIPKTDEASVETKTGRSYTYRYANLATITDLLMPIMAALGLAWVCRPNMIDGQFVLSYSLIHGPTGDEIDGFYPLPGSGSPQQIGSAITYARRYALTAVTGIAPADDDDDAAAAERAAQTDSERAAAGRMTSEQQREHAALARQPRGRKADRSNNPADDIWAGQEAGKLPPMAIEDKPGTSNSWQWKRLGILYTAANITDAGERHADLTNRTGRTITTAKDLSYVEAEQVMAELEKLAKERGQ